MFPSLRAQGNNVSATRCPRLPTPKVMVFKVLSCARLRVIAILTVTSPIVINVPTRGLLAVETKDSFVLWLAKFKYQKNCL